MFQTIILGLIPAYRDTKFGKRHVYALDIDKINKYHIDQPKQNIGKDENPMKVAYIALYFPW